MVGGSYRYTTFLVTYLGFLYCDGKGFLVVEEGHLVKEEEVGGIFQVPRRKKQEGRRTDKKMRFLRGMRDIRGTSTLKKREM